MAEDTLSLYIENDSVFLKPNGPRDRHYTSGVELVYFTQPGWKWLDDFSKWNFGDLDRPIDKGAGFFIGQQMYTPDNLDDPASRSPHDYQFAAWLYGGMFLQRATDDILDHVELNLGVIGPCAGGEWFQENVHNVTGGLDPVGWDTQIGNELAADFMFTRQNRFRGGIFEPTDSRDFIADYGFTVGSVHRDAHAGLMFRWGFNLDNSFGPGSLTLPSGISSLRFDRNKHNGYVFIRASGHAVQYNRFLTGLDHEPFVGKLQIGFVYKYKQLEIGYSQTHSTDLYEQQTDSDSIGALTVTWRF